MGKNKREPGKPTRGETTRIWASKFLEDFRASPDEVYTFGSHLSNQERGVIHQMCQRMGLHSKSSGVGDQRCISVYKRKVSKTRNKKAAHKQAADKPNFSFSPEAKVVLQELFTYHPPCDEDAEETSFGKYSRKSGKKRSWKDEFFCKPQMNRAEIASKVASLAKRVEKDTKLRQIALKQLKLPIASFCDAITSAVESNQIVLISGETGCGKTTQVPQYLLDHMWSKGETCKIICTQPRRISAISVSERIACERGESIGNDIGYKVRLQTKGGRHSSVVFCTNGILLRVLVGQGSGSCVSNITHIIVDEIHERDCYSDFMLTIMRDILPSNPHLRLILMSATLDAERFSEYFGGCPVIRVPGFTYPVKTFYLEDVLSILKSRETNHLDSASLSIPHESDVTDEEKIALDEAINLGWTNDEFDALLDLVSSEGTCKIYNYQHSSTWLTPLMVFAGKGRVSDVCMLLSFGADWSLKSKDGMTALQLAERENQLEVAQIIREYAQKSPSEQGEQLLEKYLATVNSEQVDVGLIEQLLRKICDDSEDGAILVFLPGWDDINKTREKLLRNPFFTGRNKFTIICLHSMIPAEEQRKVFECPPRGCRKIVLATNIAESAITIDDVVYVVDSGRMKEKSYDPYINVSTLQSSWISKANAKQREGRAGRCQPGMCYHLYSRLRASSLPEYSIPEIKRMPLEEVCLQVKMLDPNCKIRDFLQKLMDPPVSESVRNALIVLQDIGALTLQEELTEFGETIGQIPIHPVICKMLFFAVLVNCLDPALTLACACDNKEPFTLPMLPSERQKAEAAKIKFASLYGGESDHLAVIAAYEGWKKAKKMHQKAKFCSEHFVSMNAMRMLDGMREQLQSELIRHRIIPQDVSRCSLNSHDPGILRAVLVVGLYPMVGRLLPPANGRRPIVETANGAKAHLHSRSNAFKTLPKMYDDCALLVYDEITRGDGGMHIRNSTVVCPLPLLLFSTEIAVAPAENIGDANYGEVEGVGGDNRDEDGMDIDEAGSKHGEKIMSSPDNLVTVVVDRWLYYKTTALEAAQIYILRQRLLACILRKVRRPQEDLPPRLGASMYAIACILSCDGSRGLSFPPESVNLLTSMVEAAATATIEDTGLPEQNNLHTETASVAIERQQQQDEQLKLRNDTE